MALLPALLPERWLTCCLLTPFSTVIGTGQFPVMPTVLDPANCEHTDNEFRRSRISEYKLGRQLGRKRAADLIQQIEPAILAATTQRGAERRRRCWDRKSSATHRGSRSSAGRWE